jgi:hypothetical protein
MLYEGFYTENHFSESFQMAAYPSQRVVDHQNPAGRTAEIYFKGRSHVQCHHTSSFPSRSWFQHCLARPGETCHPSAILERVISISLKEQDGNDTSYYRAT